MPVTYMYICSALSVFVWNARRHARACQADRRARSKSVSRRGPEGTTAAAGRQGVLEGVKGGDASPQKKFVKNFFSRESSPMAASGGWRGREGGRSPPQKDTGREAPHNYLVILTLIKFFVAISCCNCIDFFIE